MAEKEKVKVLIFAGGAGRRMNSRSKPKQFLEVYGKPVIIHTLEHFEYHSEIDEIFIVCLKHWEDELTGMLHRYGIRKVRGIVTGGATGHDSIYKGLLLMRETTADNDILLIHDGVRPLITSELISDNISAVRKYGTAITCEPARESVVHSPNGRDIDDVPVREQMYVAKAPQSFRCGFILQAYERAQKDNKKTVDSAHLCNFYHLPLHMVPSTKNNMKITEPADYYIYRALYEALEAQQLYGL